MVHGYSPGEFFSKKLKMTEHKYLYNFAVHPDFRKQGLGKKLFMHIRGKHGELNLSVDKKNMDVVKFYLNLCCNIRGIYTIANLKWVCMTTEAKDRARS